MDLKAALKKKGFSESELAKVERAYELVGDIAIVSIPKELEAKKKTIAETLTEINPNVKTVLRKTEKVAGTWRTAKYEKLIGQRTETIHKESGCSFKVDATRVYFSGRLAGERLRIAEDVKEGEEILVMFAGVGPYAIVIAKRKGAKVLAVESNPLACKYAEENVLRNNVFGKVEVLCGDVADVVPRLEKKFDRIVMPAPASAFEFLPIALPKIKKGGTIHFYAFAQEKELKELQAKIENECKKLGRKIKVKQVVRAGETAPYTVRICADFVVS